MTDVETEVAEPTKKRFQFPSAMTTLMLVLIIIWLLALIIPPGSYQLDEDGAPIAGTYE